MHSQRDSQQVQKLKQDTETVNTKFVHYQVKTDEELKRLRAEKESVERQLAKVIAHSKAQSQRVQALQDSLQDKDGQLATLKKDNEHNQLYIEEQQRMIAALQKNIEALKKEKKAIYSDLQTARTTADIYKEDFEKERSDRAKVAGKLDSIERVAVENSRSLAQKFQDESSELKAKLEQAQEDMKVKAAQIKNYKKQVDSLQAELGKAQQTIATLESQTNEVVFIESCPSVEHVDANSGRKITERLKGFGKKSKAKDEQSRAKAEEKDRNKAKKLEREKSAKETMRRWKASMDSIGEQQLKQFLESELNRLEKENMFLRNQMECLEATSKCLVEKLQQTEALVVKRTESLSCPTPNAHDDKHRGSSRVSTKPPHPQRRKLSATTDPRDTVSDLDTKGLRPFTSDPRLYSTTDDYVNLPPASSKSKPKAQSPVERPRPLKSPIPTPRSISIDSRKGGGGLAIPSPHEQSISMPPMPMRREEDEEDISHGLEDDIYTGAREVVETGLDERRYTLTSIPFDPFLECLYCNQKFRYGEIQKYRKHVNNCTGTSAI